MATRDRAILGSPPPASPDLPGTPAGPELGAAVQHPGGLGGWASFVDEAEFVPELAWPSSRDTFHRMRSDSQVESLHTGTTQPIREFRWSIDPNRAPAGFCEQIAGELGLPIRGHEDDAIARSANVFDFDTFLSDALLAPLYGHFYFEIVGKVAGNDWMLTDLAPRHPRTIMDFQTTPAGRLAGIRQNIAGVGGWARMPPPIPVSKLVSFVWRPEAGSHVGRSLLRSIYREWLVKDRTIRIAAINLERAGGMPVIEGPQGATDSQLRDLARLARTFKVAEGGGGAIPFGSKLNLVGGSTPDAISLLKYCDECMARVWALMLVQLGMTQTGNRALGSEFAIYAARAQRAMAKWVCVSVNRLLDLATEWNLGPSASHAPLLHYEQAKPDAMSVTDLVSLISAGALTVDPELEAWLRDEGGLPEAPSAPTHPQLGDIAPSEVALIENSRNPPALPAPAKAPNPTIDPTSQEPTLARSTFRVQAELMLPDRELRRGLRPSEIRAAVNYRELDRAHAAVVDSAQALYREQVIPAQVKAVGDQIRALGEPLTRAKVAAITVPVLGQSDLHSHLAAAARSGANSAIAEMAAQGVTGVSAPTDAVLEARTADQAAAMSQLAANGLGLAAQRKASALVGSGSAEQVAAGVEAHLSGMKHAWTAQQLQGAVTGAQNAGRAVAFADGEAAGANVERYEASEVLDASTCDPCAEIDGTVYDSLEEAESDYPAGGYVDCDGGPNCRGVVVAIYDEANPMSASDEFTQGDGQLPGLGGFGETASETRPASILKP